MALSIRIKEVEALDNLMLSVLFVNGVKKLYDVKQLFREFPQMFTPLKDNPALFKNVTVDCGGCGISWNEDIDISECELWENGMPIEAATPDDLTEKLMF
ncbi:MAG: DUF2442 domain-containing protein [Clostridiales bacterium]|nr:DUF2442 domain-containing protein [Clostridiales bacterium]